MAGIRFNIRQRRFKHKKKSKMATYEADRGSLPAREPDDSASRNGALVACIPCPALVVDGDRKIRALNDPLCDAFGVRAGFFHIGEDYADFACGCRLYLGNRPAPIGLASVPPFR